MFIVPPRSLSNWVHPLQAAISTPRCHTPMHTVGNQRLWHCTMQLCVRTRILVHALRLVFNFKRNHNVLFFLIKHSWRAGNHRNGRQERERRRVTGQEDDDGKGWSPLGYPRSYRVYVDRISRQCGPTMRLHFCLNHNLDTLYVLEMTSTKM